MIYACEPRGIVFREDQPPIFHSFVIWFYREFIKPRTLNHTIAQRISERIFPGCVYPYDLRKVRRWYEAKPNFPEELHRLGFQLPEEYLNEWLDSHSREAKEWKDIAFLQTACKKKPKSSRLRPQEYSNKYYEVRPVYYYCYTPADLLFTQMVEAMCWITFLAIVSLYMRKSLTIAKP